MKALTDCRIRIYGHTGFIGSHLVNHLIELGCTYKKNLELYGSEIDLFRNDPPSNTMADYTFNLVGVNGGISMNLGKGPELFIQNTILNLRLLTHEIIFSKKILNTIPSCAYPSSQWQIAEEDLWRGPVHPSVLGHGVAKRQLDTMAKLFRDKCRIINVTPTTVYGSPNHLSLDRVKVLESLIIKFIKAKKEHRRSVVLFGNGEVMREFIHVKDLVKLLVHSMRVYEEELPLNLGTGQEFLVKDLANMVRTEVGYEGPIIWDGVEQGEYRKRLNLDKMISVLGFPEFTDFKKGLAETVEWYKQQLE